MVIDPIVAITIKLHLGLVEFNHGLDECAVNRWVNEKREGLSLGSGFDQGGNGDTVEITRERGCWVLGSTCRGNEPFRDPLCIPK